MATKFNSDIDIDMANRDHILGIISHSSASIRSSESGARRHNTGVYVTDIPYDPASGMANIDYQAAETRGYVKLDFLNVNVYTEVRSEEHLVELMAEPDWTLLRDRQFVEQIININKHYDTIAKMPEPVDSIPRLAMLLAVIRPGKRHLIGQPWKIVAETIWDASDDGYSYKKSHSIAYSNLVVVHMNLLAAKLKASV